MLAGGTAKSLSCACKHGSMDMTASVDGVPPTPSVLPGREKKGLRDELQPVVTMVVNTLKC